MRLLYTFFIVLSLLVSCQNRSKNTIEDKLMKCVENEFSRENINIRTKLDSLETFLIEQNVLKDTTGQSYFAFFSELEMLGDHPYRLHKDTISKYYDKTELKLLKRCFISSCMGLLRKNKEKDLLSSKIFKLDSASQTYNGRLASLNQEFIQPKDFNHPFYKTYALFIIISGILPTRARIMPIIPTKKEEPYSGFKELKITLNDKGEIFWGRERIRLFQLNNKLKGFFEFNLNTHYLHIFSSKGSCSNLYNLVLNKAIAIHNQKVNDKAIQLFGQNLYHLSKANQEKVRKRYPIRINRNYH